MSHCFFLFGTLRHRPLLERVLGGPADTCAATLPGHAVMRAAGQSFPILVADPGATADGVLLRTDDAGAARLRLYEEGYEYALRDVRVQTAAGPVAAQVFAADDSPLQAEAPWSLDVWAARYAPATVEAVDEVLDLARNFTPAVQQARYPMVLVRADSALRARANPAPATLRRTPQAEDLCVDTLRRPYAWFFGVEEADLRFRRFDGGLSPRVTRAGFVVGDAVTVLPYDPVTDRVMLVEQYRFGPHLRGDPNPWSLEPIAGRIDPGEDPETAARRESTEEAGLTLRQLCPVARCYPSPGAVTEYIFMYVGLADLSAADEGVGGAEAEAEDIRAHVIGFDRLMALVSSGEAENGPLLATAFWLALHRAELRANT